MESEEQWSCRDFTQIKPRRPEGPAEEEWEEVESSPFSFLWSGGGNELEVEEENESSHNNKMEEFEFSSVEEPAVVERLSPNIGSGISPADELFFKGQLLPLHLPPRIQMVKKLSSLENNNNNQQQSNRGSPARTTRNVHRNEEIIARVNALMQARFTRLFQPNKYSKFCIQSTSSSSDGSQWWDPNNTDSSDCTSSRDSSGSSQDGFQEHHYTTDSKGLSFLHNREVFSTGGEQRGASTWLRPPFKWKVLFGNAKKQSRPDDIAKTHSMEATTDRMADLFPASSSPAAADRYYSDCSGELTPSGNLRNGAFIHGSTDTDKNRGARGYLQRYMKALNPSRSSKSDGHVADEGSKPVANNRSFPPFSQSFRISPKDISLKMNTAKKSPPASSPGPLPRPRVSTSSASSELHSAIQGAIAHCKESQKQSQRQDGSELPNSNCVGYLPKVAAVN